MSFRAVILKVKQVGVQILQRQRVFLHGRYQPKAPQVPQDRQLGLTVQAQRLDSAPTNRLLRSFIGYRAVNTAVKFRRNAALKLIEFRYKSSGGRGCSRSSRWGGSGAHLPVYAFLGLTLAAGERGFLKDNENGRELVQLPLETCCNIVRDIFQSTDTDLKPHPSTVRDFPSDTSSYDISTQLLGKGTSASIYAARLRQPVVQPDNISEAVDSTSNGDDAFKTEEDWVMVSENDGEDVQDDDDSDEVSLERRDSFSDVEETQGLEEGQHDAGERFNLALKMMFNYDIASNANTISQAFEREYLPLWPSLDNGSFGALSRWENGHRAKKNEHILPSHPNIVEIHHAFVAPTVVHDLQEAKDLFPAALPTRIHIDGMGRNQTMFLVMKRYDMTLAEFNQYIGCQSQHVAMVIIAQLLEGVSHLVHHGIAHRDLKSNNILIEVTTGSPRVVIADFGCCLADDTVGLKLPYPTKHTEIGGNSALMAPEVKLSIPGPTASISYSKSDTWAVGAICYEILGVPNPFYRHGNIAGLDSALYEDEDLPKLPDNVHPRLRKVVYLLLKKDPLMRPTASVAANMVHMSLWHLPVASLEGCELSHQQDITTWLLQMSAGLLCQRSFKGQRSWLDDTEYQLCVEFMSRLNPDDLLTAASHLHI